MQRTGKGSLALLVVLTLFAIPASPGYAAPDLNPVPPLFTTQLAGGWVYHSSPVLADLDHDGKLEIVLGSLQNCSQSTCPNNPERWNELGYPAYLSVVNPNGAIRWQRATGSSINSSPAVDDIDGDGQPDIVVGLGGQDWPLNGGGVAAYSAAGQRKWTATTLDRTSPGNSPTRGRSDGRPDGVFGSPSIADVNGDGQKEVIFGAWDMRMHVVDGRNGQPVADWTAPEVSGGPVYPGLEMLDTIWSSPAIADLNGDGRPDFAFGGDISQNAAAGTHNGGLLRAMQGSGARIAGAFSALYGTLCPVAPCPTDTGHYGVYVEQSLASSPAIGDLNRDGNPEIVIGSGRAFAPNVLGHWVKVFDRAGNLLRTLPTDGNVFASPALADLNSDGYLDIIAATEILSQNSAPAGRGTVYAWSGKDFAPLWHSDPALSSGRPAIMPITSSPVVADIDTAHPGPEVLFGFGAEIVVLSAAGEQLTADGPASGKPTLWIGRAPVSNSPAVGDIDLDGHLEIVAAGEYFPPGNLTRTYHGWVVAWRWPAGGSAAAARLPWPMFRHDAQHLASIDRACGRAGPTMIHVLYDPRDGPQDKANAASTITLENCGELTFTWTVSARPPGLQTSPGSGTLLPGALAIIATRMTAVTYGPGTYEVGSIVLTPSDGALAVPGGPFAVAVELHVGRIRHMWLPMVGKSR